MDDPNQDLIGFEFETFTDGRLRVVGSTEWSSQYVTCRRIEGGSDTVRAAGLVRQSRTASLDTPEWKST